MVEVVRTAGGAEIIRLPNTLQTRIGPKLRVFTAALVRKAEVALEQVVARFGPWLEEEVHHLERARDRSRETGLTETNLKELCRTARHLRGSGATFGYPIISRIAGSLTNLLDRSSTPPLALVDAHIDAIRASIRDHVRSPDHLVASPLCEELEAQVAQAIG